VLHCGQQPPSRRPAPAARLQQLALGGAGERAEAALVGGGQLAGLLAQLRQLGQLAAARHADLARLRARRRRSARPPRPRTLLSVAVCAAAAGAPRARASWRTLRACAAQGRGGELTASWASTAQGSSRYTGLGQARLRVQRERLHAGRDALAAARDQAHDLEPGRRHLGRQLVHRHVAGRRHQHLRARIYGI